MSSDRGLGQGRVIAARSNWNVERLPAGKRLISDNEIAGQILTTPRHRQQNVILGPINHARRQPQIGVNRSEVSSQESRWACVRELYRKPV